MFDSIIVGAGPAGLSAALLLGRCRRSVLLCDAGQPRNATAHAIHNYLGCEGIAPVDFLRIGREELHPYTSVEFRSIEVVDVFRIKNYFTVIMADQTTVDARTLLLATGIVDHLPPLQRIEQFFGQSVFHCPYCHGWEVRDQPLAVYGKGSSAWQMTFRLWQWSQDLVLCTDGPSELKLGEISLLKRRAIPVYEEPIASLDGHDGQLTHIVFANGEKLMRRALFLRADGHPRNALATKLGYQPLTPGNSLRSLLKFSLAQLRSQIRSSVQMKSGVPTQANWGQDGKIPGLYLVGDVNGGRWVAGAVADGVEAGTEMNEALIRDDLARASHISSSDEEEATRL